MNGVIVGGWSFVVGAYALTGFVFLAYGVMVITRVREGRRRLADEGRSR